MTMFIMMTKMMMMTSYYDHDDDDDSDDDDDDDGNKLCETFVSWRSIESQQLVETVAPSTLFHHHHIRNGHDDVRGCWAVLAVPIDTA